MIGWFKRIVDDGLRRELAEALDEIENLRATIERMDDERVRLYVEIDGLEFAAAAAREENAQLHADNKRLRAILGHIRDIVRGSRGVCGWHANGDEAAWDHFFVIEELHREFEAKGGESEQ